MGTSVLRAEGQNLCHVSGWHHVKWFREHGRRCPGVGVVISKKKDVD